MGWRRFVRRRPPVGASNSDVLTRKPSRGGSGSGSARRSTLDDLLEKRSPTAPYEKPLIHPDSSTEDITALPPLKPLDQSPHLRPITKEFGGPYNNFDPSAHDRSHTSLSAAPRNHPSLRRSLANDTGLLHRSSKSKKREHDWIREEEIRTMSAPLPQKRPAGHSSGFLKRDSKKVKKGSSNISLPFQNDSIHSSMSGNSEIRAFRVSALDMFSPRPTIRCSVGSQHYYSGIGASPSSQEKSNTRRERRASLSRDGKEAKQSKTIDDLADTLDAGALREILERDKRRREKKRKAEEERLRRRLERRAEKQKAAEQGGTPTTPRREAGGAAGLGLVDAPIPMEDVRPTTPPREHPQRQRLDTALPPKVEGNSQLPTPLESPMEEPVVADARAVRYSRASMSPSPPSHARGPSNVSELPALLSELAAPETPPRIVEHAQDPNASGSLHPVETVDTVATSKKGSSRRGSSEGRRMSAFASFFRRGRNSQDQKRTTPSEKSFSNTSRESMSRQQPLPAHLVGPSQPIQIPRPSGVPHRTMSKFREDLPEFPLSPPDSRLQSPEITSASAIAARRQDQRQAELRLDSSSPDPSRRTDSPVSPTLAAAGLMSQSMASVDSEGSWLSGKPIKRQSNKSHLRSSVGSSTALKRNEEFDASYEELGIPDDEYIKRPTPRPDEQRQSGHSGDALARNQSSTAMGDADADAGADFDEEPLADESTIEEEMVKSGDARQPTIVHRQPRVKSTEGLLSYFDKPSLEEDKAIAPDAEELMEQDSPVSEGEMPLVQRAHSVDLGKHHTRELSVGSAKLLDIPARGSPVGPKRLSQTSQSTLPEQ